MKRELCRILDHGIWVLAHRDPEAWRISPCCVVKNSFPMQSNNWQKPLRDFRTLNTCNDCADHAGLGENLDTRAMSFGLLLPEGTDDSDILYANITLSTECNAACMSCGPRLSTTWEKQMIKLNNEIVPDLANKISLTDQEIVERLFDVIDFNKIVNLNIAGGEPFYTSSTELLLERIVNECNPENIALSFYTNCSVPISPGLVTLLGKFKSVKLVLSLDGTGKRFEYLRYPLNWDRVLRVIDSYKAVPEITEFKINMATGILNVWYYNEFEAWASEFFKGDSRYVGTSTTRCVGEIGLAAITAPMAADLLEKYQNNTALKTLISRFTSRDNINQFLEYTSKMDKFRNQSWRETFPDIVKYIDL